MSIQPARLLRPLTAAIALLLSIAAIPAAIATPTPTAPSISHKNSGMNNVGEIGTQALLDTVTTLPVMEGIDLSDEQYSQLYAVVDTTREQIVSIISIEQQTQFQTTLDDSGDFNAAVKAMNLSEQQKSQLDFIVQVFGFQAASILTPEQQRIISANIEGL